MQAPAAYQREGCQASGLVFRSEQPEKGTSSGNTSTTAAEVAEVLPLPLPYAFRLAPALLVPLQPRFPMTLKSAVANDNSSHWFLP